MTRWRGFVILDIEDTEEGRFGYIVTLDVSPGIDADAWQGKLMEEVEREASCEGCAAIVLHVFTGNEPAIRFYIGRGFPAIAWRERFLWSRNRCVGISQAIAFSRRMMAKSDRSAIH